MLKDNITEILEAESEAEKIIAAAEESAKEFVISAEARLEELRNKNREEIAEYKKTVLAAAEKRAEAETAVILAAARTEGEKISAAASKNTKTAVEFVVEKVLDKYGK